MVTNLRNLGRRIFATFPQRIRNGYFQYRISNLPLRKFLFYSEEADLLSLLPFQPKTIVDIGANHGKWTNGLLKVLGKDTTFYLFEPNPSLYSELKRKFNSYTNVTVDRFAVSNISGNADFFIADDDAMSSLENLDSNAYHHKVQTSNTKVQTETLDIIHQTILGGSAIDLLKIDTQGHEKAIIECSQVALYHTKAILVEWSIIPIYQNEVDFIALHQQLIKKGFRLSHIFNRPRHNYELTWADALYLNQTLLNEATSP